MPPVAAPEALLRRRAGAAVRDLGGETMGTRWSARLVEPADGMPPGIDAAIGMVLDRIVGQMSHWEPESDISRFNRAGIDRWCALPPEFVRVLAAALDVARASDGAFDPAMGRLADLWGFGPSGLRAVPPHEVEVARLHAAAGPGAVELDAPLLRARRRRDVALDFSGIAKGYAVDAVAHVLHGRGLTDFLVEIGGELYGAGVRPDGQPWWVDLEAVPGAETAPVRIALHELAVATSGDYRRGFTHDGRRYAHTLDSRTGRPSEAAVASVTVLHPQAMLADAWATALTVLGPVEGMAAAEREGLAAHMVERTGAGGREHWSPAFAAMLG